MNPPPPPFHQPLSRHNCSPVQFQCLQMSKCCLKYPSILRTGDVKPTPLHRLWLGWRMGTSLLHMIQHRAGLSRHPLFTSILCMAHQTQLYTSWFGWNLLYSRLFLSGTTTLCYFPFKTQIPEMDTTSDVS
jgi:hypothetical protein